MIKNKSRIRSMRCALGVVACVASVFAFGLVDSVWAVEVETKTVEVTGTGTTLQGAITEGLIEAIGQVSGRMLESETAMRSIEASATDGQDEAYFASEEFQQNIKSATKGAVKEYRILKQEKNDAGLFEVSLSVDCLKVVPDSDGRKKLVCSTFPFKGLNKPELFGEAGASPSIIFTDSLEANIVQTRRFSVLDRRETDALAKEKAIVINGNLPIEDILKVSTDNPAELVVVGSIDAVDYTTTTRTLPSGRTVSIGEGFIEINFRVVDVPSRRVKYADRFRQVYDDGILRDLSGSLAVNRPGNLMLSDSARRICKQILESIYPARVIKVVGDTVTLNEGGRGVEIGQIYDVLALGEDLFDPYTKEKLGQTETLVGKVKIVSSAAKMATGTVVEKSGDIAEGSICRLAKEQKLEKATDQPKPGKKISTDDLF